MKKETQEFLENLNAEDVKKIERALHLYETAEILTWAGKWLVLTLIAILIGITQFGDTVSKIKAWF